MISRLNTEYVKGNMNFASLSVSVESSYLKKISINFTFNLRKLYINFCSIYFFMEWDNIIYICKYIYLINYFDLVNIMMYIYKYT